MFKNVQFTNSIRTKYSRYETLKSQIFVKNLKLYAKYVKLVGIFFSIHIVIIKLRIHCKSMKININYLRKIKINW